MALQISAVVDGALEVIDFDASLTEGHNFSAEITDYPVESGSNVTDNIRAKPVMLRLETFVADFPLNNDGRSKTSSGAVTQQKKASNARAKGAWAQLQQWQIDGQTLEVNTGIKRYTDMVIQDIELPRDKTVAKGLRITITLKQIRIVATQTVAVTKAADSRSTPARKDGPKTTEPASDGEDSSLLHQAKEKVLDLFGGK